MPDTLVAPPAPAAPPTPPPAAPASPAPAAPAPAKDALKPGESRLQASMSKLRDSLKDATHDGKPLADAPKPPTQPANATPEPPPNRPGAVEPAKPDASKADPAKPLDGKPATAPDGKPGDPAIDPATGKPAKLPGPWQLKEKYEKLARDYERRALDAESKLAKIGDHETISKRAQEAEARAAKYEEEMRYIDYSKSSEFAEKYQKPYLAAWEKAERDITQLTFTADDGSTRPATVQDFLSLANMPAGDSDAAAEAWFGKSAQRVLRHVDKMRDLSEAQQTALADARKTGSERQTQQAEAVRTAKEEASRFWQESVAEDDDKRDFLRPKEDDEEWNGHLEKSRSFVEAAIRDNPADPKLTSEQRREVIRKKAALRGRAIGYTMRGVEIGRLKTQLAARDAELAQIKGTQPGAGNGTGRTDNGFAAVTDPMERSKARWREMSKGVTQ